MPHIAPCPQNIAANLYHVHYNLCTKSWTCTAQCALQLILSHAMLTDLHEFGRSRWGLGMLPIYTLCIINSATRVWICTILCALRLMLKAVPSLKMPSKALPSGDVACKRCPFSCASPPAIIARERSVAVENKTLRRRKKKTNTHN